MKKIFFYAFISLMAVSCKSESKEPVAVEDKGITEMSEELCFINITQSQQDPLIIDTLSLTFIKNGNKVSGVYNWLPYEKDKKTGTYIGTFDKDIVNAIYTYNAEGQTLKEELIFRIKENSVQIKNGELEEIDGVWKLKNKDAAEYNVKLTQITCN